MSAKFMKSAFVGWTFTAGVYYPPDFDATKLMPVKMLKPKGPQMMNIRMMFPFTMVCDSCKEYNYTGTKFTAKTEQIKGEEYLGIKVYRFYGRCRHCWSEFTFKTDPKNSDYTMESGGKRTYEAWKDADAMESKLKTEAEKEAAQDQMKALEQKAVDVQSEMQRLEDLDAIRTMNKRQGARDQTIQEALDYIFQKDVDQKAQEERLPDADQKDLAGFHEAQEERKRKLLDDEVDLANEERIPSSSSSAAAASSSAGDDDKKDDKKSSLPNERGSAMLMAIAERAKEQAAKAAAVGARFTVKVKRKGAPEEPKDVAAEPDAKRHCSDAAASAANGIAGPTAAATSATGIGGLGAYDSDSS